MDKTTNSDSVTLTNSAVPVLVTTEYRGVFFGYLEARDDDKGTVVLTGARAAIRWHTTGGFLELADKGPNANSRIGSRAPRIELRKVTAIAEVSPAAVEAWERA